MNKTLLGIHFLYILLYYIDFNEEQIYNFFDCFAYELNAIRKTFVGFSFTDFTCALFSSIVHQFRNKWSLSIRTLHINK